MERHEHSRAVDDPLDDTKHPARHPHRPGDLEMTAPLRPVYGCCPVCHRVDVYLVWRRVPPSRPLLATCMDSVGCARTIQAQADRRNRKARKAAQAAAEVVRKAAQAAAQVVRRDRQDAAEDALYAYMVAHSEHPDETT